jgi:hypothetical protein
VSSISVKVYGDADPNAKGSVVAEFQKGADTISGSCFAATRLLAITAKYAFDEIVQQEIVE